MAYTKNYQNATRWLLIVGGCLFLAAAFSISLHIYQTNWVCFYIGIADIVMGLFNFGIWYFCYFRYRKNFKQRS